MDDKKARKERHEEQQARLRAVAEQTTPRWRVDEQERVEKERARQERRQQERAALGRPDGMFAGLELDEEERAATVAALLDEVVGTWRDAAEAEAAVVALAHEVEARFGRDATFALLQTLAEELR